MVILVTSGTGAIGPRVVQSLYQAGFRVCAFSVDGSTAGVFP